MAKNSDHRRDARRADKARIASSEKGIALYHMVYQDEGFEQAATALFELVRDAERRYPGKPRLLYLDIEGHRNEQGGYDHNMYELQREFAIDFLMPFLTEAHLPLAHVKNPKPQRNDVPDELTITPAEESGPPDTL